MNVVIWTRDNCPYCVSAKMLLKQKGIQYQEKKIGEGYTKEDLLASVPDAQSIPQIIIDDELVGGFKELQLRIKEIS